MTDTASIICAHGALPGDLVALHSVDLPAQPPEWVQLLPLGTFKGRDGRGPYTVRNQADAQRVIDLTLQRQGSAKLPIDYDHQSDFAAIPGVGGQAPAAGWIEELQARGDGIWGRVSWTQAGAARIAAREYRYLSPVFTHAKTAQGEVGVLLRAGLTNNPNLELTALASAGASSHGSERDAMDLAALLAALSLPATTTWEQALAHARTLTSNLTAAQAGVSAVAMAAGLAANAAADQVATAVATQRAAADKPDPAKYVPIETHTVVATQLRDLQAAVNKSAAEAEVSAAITAGKLAPAQKDWATAYASSDLAGFKAFIEKAPVVVTPGSVVTGKPGDSDGPLSAEDKAVCAAMGISEADFLKTKKEA
jgi:phage I-like protein